MNEPTPFHFGYTQCRVIEMDGKPWFVAADVTQILGYSNGQKAVRDHVPNQHVRRGERIVHPFSTSGYADVTLIDEAGLYRLVLRSNQPGAEVFREWVTSEVIPAIRRDGKYAPEQERVIPQSFAEALQLAADQARALEAARPAIQFVEELVSADGLYRMSEVAAILKVSGMGQNNLFAFLRDHKVLYRANGRNLPMRPHIEAGRFEMKAQTYDVGQEKVATSTPYVTGKGLVYIRDLLEKNGHRCIGAVPA